MALVVFTVGAIFGLGPGFILGLLFARSIVKDHDGLRLAD